MVDFLSSWGESQWLIFCLIAVVTSVIIHTVFLMFAKAFSIRELENYSKSEMLQAAATTLMAIMLTVMINSALDLIGGTSTNHGVFEIAGTINCNGHTLHIERGHSAIDQAFAAIRCKIQEKASNVASIQESILSSSDTWAEFNLMNTQMSVLGIPVFRGDWVSSLYQTTENKRIINNLATVLLIGLDGQSALFEYVRANMLTIFIPVGIILRSVYFTRSVGALLISLGIGLYFIFPVLYITLDPGFIPAPLPTSNPVTVMNYCYPTMSNTISMFSNLESSGFGSTNNVALTSVSNDLSKSYISLIVHPLVVFSITMVFVRYIMSVLGGDTFEIMKMVSKVI